MKYWLATILFLLPLVLQAAGGITLTPAKIEIQAKSGESVIRQIQLTNNTSDQLSVTVEIEDFVGSEKADETIQFLGDERSAYSLRDRIQIAAADQEFSLASGESRSVPVNVALATSTPGGGYYAAVFFTAAGPGGGNINAISRLGALVFVTVDGPVRREAILREFGVVGNQAQVLFENQGDVYLNPYGYISVANLWGREIFWQEIEPWFVLPHALRQQTVELKQPLGLGYYHVKLALNRGYDNVIDERTISKIVWPKFITILIIVVLAVAAIASYKRLRI
ncbi:MAG: hypothetical protein HYT48_01605 [Candidatus Vogelbacteria bacterium]|nr:hypothetical protein [Candidatus Vogelbacteria bacterium]